MIKYKTVITVFILWLTSAVLLYLYDNISLWWAVLSVVFLLVMLALGSYFIRMNFYLDSINTIKSKNEIVITFDDGPHENNTEKILEVLDKYNAKAIFFVIGKKAEKHPEILKKIIAKGHIIGNHSYEHSFWYDLLPARKIAADIKKCNDTIKEITSQETYFFRPPYGVTNPAIAKAVRQLQMIVVGWSLRSMDTVTTDSMKLMKKLKKAKAGQIILFHDTVEGMDKILHEFLIHCQKNNLRFTLLNNTKEATTQ